MKWLLQGIGTYRDRPCIVHQGNRYTYTNLFQQAEGYYSEIQREIPSGSVVAISSDYSFYSISLFLALLQNKNIIVPITTAIQSEVDQRLTNSFADNVISVQSEKLSIQRLVPKEPKHDLILKLQSTERSGLILFSSGMTGKPKAMIHDLDTLVDSFQGKKPKNLTFLVFLMFDHIGGLNTLFNCLAMGATLVLPDSRDTEYICRLIEENKVEILPASPTFLNLIYISGAYKKFDLSSLKLVTYGTEPMPESLLLRLRTVFPRVKFLQTFGTSETGIAQTSSKSSTSTLIKIDDPNLEYKILDGELLLRSKTQILGYINSSMESFTADGWFKTGDLIETTEGGYLKIIGRKSDMINVGGQKVLPSEIESVLMLMPEVDDCIVYGEPNAITGRMVTVEIVTNIPVEKSAIIRHCRNYLDPYKIPARIRFVDKPTFTERYKKIRKH